jgi:hypothetical protein
VCLFFCSLFSKKQSTMGQFFLPLWYCLVALFHFILANEKPELAKTQMDLETASSSSANCQKAHTRSNERNYLNFPESA